MDMHMSVVPHSTGAIENAAHYGSKSHLTSYQVFAKSEEDRLPSCFAEWVELEMSWEWAVEGEG